MAGLCFGLAKCPSAKIPATRGILTAKLAGVVIFPHCDKRSKTPKLKIPGCLYRFSRVLLSIGECTQLGLGKNAYSESPKNSVNSTFDGMEK
jgi:hypothetical protein